MICGITHTVLNRNLTHLLGICITLPHFRMGLFKGFSQYWDQIFHNYAHWPIFQITYKEIHLCSLISSIHLRDTKDLQCLVPFLSPSSKESAYKISWEQIYTAYHLLVLLNSNKGKNIILKLQNQEIQALGTFKISYKLQMPLKTQVFKLYKSTCNFYTKYCT